MDTPQQFINSDIESVRHLHQSVEARPPFSGFKKTHPSAAQSSTMGQLFLANALLVAQFFDSACEGA